MKNEEEQGRSYKFSVPALFYRSLLFLYSSSCLQMFQHWISYYQLYSCKNEKKEQKKIFLKETFPIYSIFFSAFPKSVTVFDVFFASNRSDKLNSNKNIRNEQNMTGKKIIRQIFRDNLE